MIKLLFLLLVPISFSFSQDVIKVIGIKDGDTISVLDTSDNTSFTIRLAEIDCPEKKQDFGQKAKQMTSDLVFGKFVRLEKIGKDRNNRVIAKVFYDNDIYLSETLIKKGMAWVFRKYTNNAHLINLEAEAKQNKVGLWGNEKAIEPSVWRKQKKIKHISE